MSKKIQVLNFTNTSKCSLAATYEAQILLGLGVSDMYRIMSFSEIIMSVNVSCRVRVCVLHRQQLSDNWASEKTQKAHKFTHHTNKIDLTHKIKNQEFAEKTLKIGNWNKKIKEKHTYFNLVPSESWKDWSFCWKRLESRTRSE